MSTGLEAGGPAAALSARRKPGAGAALRSHPPGPKADERPRRRRPAHGTPAGGAVSSPPDMTFPGGSAWAMARDIAEGFTLVTERSFRAMTRADLDQLSFEIERHMRELRGNQPPGDDLSAIQLRNRRVQRLNTAVMVLRSYRQKMKF